MVSGYIGSMDDFQREKGVLWMVPVKKIDLPIFSLLFLLILLTFVAYLLFFPCFAELLTLKGNCIMGMKICWVSREFIYRWNAIIKIDRICMRRRWQPIYSSRIRGMQYDSPNPLIFYQWSIPCVTMHWKGMPLIQSWCLTFPVFSCPQNISWDLGNSWKQNEIYIGELP